MPFINELLLYHPGLEFLEGHPDFHPKYTSTVISRIFYIVNRARNGRITQRELRRSNLVEVFEMVDEEEDINKVTQYFSYEHFYGEQSFPGAVLPLCVANDTLWLVLFCRFYELDVDRTNRLTREHLLRYGDHGLSNVIVNRIFDAGPRPFEEPGHPSDRSFMSYEDYVFFMLRYVRDAAWPVRSVCAGVTLFHTALRFLAAVRRIGVQSRAFGTGFSAVTWTGTGEWIIWTCNIFMMFRCIDWRA